MTTRTVLYFYERYNLVRRHPAFIKIRVIILMLVFFLNGRRAELNMVCMIVISKNAVSDLTIYCSMKFIGNISSHFTTDSKMVDAKLNIPETL